MVSSSGAFKHSKADWSGFQMVETKCLPKITSCLITGPVFKWHLKIGPGFKWLDHFKDGLKKSGFQMFSCVIQMFGFQIPTVVWLVKYKNKMLTYA
jgi:hypothetical protein